MNRNSSERDAETTLDEEMISTTPPPIAPRMMATMMILLFAAVCYFAVFVDLPETVRCRFVLISEEGEDPIESRLFGVLSEVHVKEGGEVKAGQPLFAVRSDEIRTWRAALQSTTNELESIYTRMEKTSESHDKKRQILESILTNVVSSVAYHSNYFVNREIYYNRMTNLHKENVISDDERDSAELEYLIAKKNMDLEREKRAQNEFEIQKLLAERSKERATEEAELATLKQRQLAFTKQLEDCHGDELYIRAPFDAVVIHMANRSVGSVIDENEALCQLTRKNGNIQARLYLDDASLPKIETNRTVRYLFDAFPYQRYGTITGTVEWISPATVQSPESSRFIATSSLSTNEFKVGTKKINGETHDHIKPVQVGMTGQARITVGSRKLVEFLFEPIKRLRENLK